MITTTTKSFVEVVQAPSFVRFDDVSHATSPYHVGDIVTVKISESTYQKRLALCKDSLVGRLFLDKGEKP